MARLEGVDHLASMLLQGMPLARVFKVIYKILIPARRIIFIEAFTAVTRALPNEDLQLLRSEH